MGISSLHRVQNNEVYQKGRLNELLIADFELGIESAIRNPLRAQERLRR